MSLPNNTNSSVGKGKTGLTPKKSSSDRDPGRKKTNRNVVTPHNFDTKHYNGTRSISFIYKSRIKRLDIVMMSTKVDPLHVHATLRSNISPFKNGEKKETSSYVIAPALSTPVMT